jgi:hypothetical protein
MPSAANGRGTSPEFPRASLGRRVWPTSSPLVSTAWLELGRGAPAARRPSYGRRNSVCGGRRLQGTSVVWLGRFRERIGVQERCGRGGRSTGRSGQRAQRQLCLWWQRSGVEFQEEGALLVWPQRRRERGGVGPMAPSERPSGPSCMRVGRAARASDDAWPGSARPLAWARRTATWEGGGSYDARRVHNDTHGTSVHQHNTGKPRGWHGPDARATRWMTSPVSSSISFKPFRNCKTPKVVNKLENLQK